jgi:hypothetical protein
MNETQSTNYIVPNDSLNLIQRLREILLIKRPISNDNQVEAGKIVALSAIQFHNELSNETAFELMALLTLAKINGINEAKKRTINLSRWLNTEPPSLKLLTNQNEKIAAVKGLSSIEFKWALNYIQASILDQPLDEDLAKAILQWGRVASTDLTIFLKEVYTPVVLEIKDAKLLAKLLKECLKFFTPFTETPQNQLAIALNMLSLAILKSVENFKKNKKEVILVLQSALAILNESWHYTPSLLLQPNFINAYEKITLSLSNYKKIPSSSFSQIESATISLLVSSIATGGECVIKQLHPMLIQWARIFPNFQKILKTIARKNIAIKNLIEYDPNSTNDNLSELENSESVFAALLPAWDRYTQTLNDNQVVAPLTHLINKAAKCANIESFGEREQIIPYDPLSHNLSNDQSIPPINVRIVRPGVLVRRPDQSIRILVQAFTSSE